MTLTHEPVKKWQGLQVRPAGNPKDKEHNKTRPRMKSHTTIGGRLPPSIMGARWQNLRLARGSDDSICLRAHHYLYHGLARPHTRPRTHTTSFHTTTLHSHIIPAHTAPPHSHLYFGYKLPVQHVTLVFASVAAQDRDTLHIHSTHSIKTRTHPTPTRLGKNIHKSLGCTLLLPSPKSVRLWGVHRHRTGWRLIDVPFRSTLQKV